MSDTIAPFKDCKFVLCDLPGQCLEEGKCHHPDPAKRLLALAAHDPAVPKIDDACKAGADHIAALEAALKAANERADVALEMAAKVCDEGWTAQWAAAKIRALQSSDAAKVVENSRRYEWLKATMGAIDVKGGQPYLVCYCMHNPSVDGIDAAIDQARDAARKP